MSGSSWLAAPGGLSRGRAVALAVAVVTLIAGYDLVAGSGVVLIGLLTVGPCLTAVAGNARAVAAVGAYVAVLSLLLSWPDRLWWSREQALFLGGIAAVTAVSLALARHLSALRHSGDERERALRHSEEHHRRIIETTSEGVLMTDVDGRVTYANRQWAELVGCPFDGTIVGQLVADLIGDVATVDTVDETVGQLAAAMTGPAGAGGGSADHHRRHAAGVGVGRRQRFRLRHRDGHDVFVASSITPLTDPDGAPAGMLSMTTDISDQRRLEGQLRQAQKLEAVGQLAGGVAHDFNNLLTVIDGYAAMLLEGPDGPGPERRYTEQIRAATERAATLIRQLLMFSSTRVVRPQSLDLSEVVSCVEGMLQRLIREDVRLTFTPAAEPVCVSADRGLLEQVLVNLVVNGRDAMPAGGQLMIETGSIELSGAEAQRYLELGPGRYGVLTVSDTGEGMTDEVKTRLFEPFFTTKERGKGTGLGLSTVYGIVQQAGGHIAVYSEVGVGTTIKVSIPWQAVLGGDDETVRPGPGIGVARGNETILLVEDDDAVRALSEQILRGAGYTVVPARDGDEALAMDRCQGVDLVLTDVIMPGMNGVQLAERLADRYPHLPVLFTSGYTHGVVGQIGPPGRTIGHLDKPYTAVTLTQHIRAALAYPVLRDTAEIDR